MLEGGTRDDPISNTLEVPPVRHAPAALQATFANSRTRPGRSACCRRHGRLLRRQVHCIADRGRDPYAFAQAESERHVDSNADSHPFTDASWVQLDRLYGLSLIHI